MASVAGGDQGCCRNWADLPPEIAGSISERLNFIDYVRFAAVCNSWASVASAGARSKVGRCLYFPCATKSPYLLLHGGGGGGGYGEQSEAGTLLSFPDNVARRICPLPELRGKWCVGSNHGWLITFDDRCNLALLNPLTRSHIPLPPLTTLPSTVLQPTYEGSSISTYVCNSPLCVGSNPVPADIFRFGCMRKVTLSVSPGDNGGDYTVVALLRLPQILICTRAGEEKWSILEYGWFEDVIYRGDGRFWVLSFSKQVSVINFDGCGTLTKLAKLDIRAPEFAYLVDSEGDLFHVSRDTQYIESEHMYKTQSVQVLRSDPSQGTWALVKSLGDRSFFLGAGHSMSVSTRDVHGLAGNCIYFTDECWESFGDKEILEMTRDICVFNLEDGSFKPSHPEDPGMQWPPPIWITPTLG